MYANDALQNVYRSEKLKSYRYYKNHILKHVVKSSKAPENSIYTSTVDAYRMNAYLPKLPSIENNLKSSLVPLKLKNDVYAYIRVYQSPAEPKLYKEKS